MNEKEEREAALKYHKDIVSKKLDLLTIIITNFRTDVDWGNFETTDKEILKENKINCVKNIDEIFSTLKDTMEEFYLLEAAIDFKYGKI